MDWFKSSFSVLQGACVEASNLPDGGMAVRDTKNRGKEPLYFTREEWLAFTLGAKAGEFDLL
jgi:hypothetical protein